MSLRARLLAVCVALVCAAAALALVSLLAAGVAVAAAVAVNWWELGRARSHRWSRSRARSPPSTSPSRDCARRPNG